MTGVDSFCVHSLPCNNSASKPDAVQYSGDPFLLRAAVQACIFQETKSRKPLADAAPEMWKQLMTVEWR